MLDGVGGVADAGGVDESYCVVADCGGVFDDVACGAVDVGNDGAVVVEQGVEQ